MIAFYPLNGNSIVYSKGLLTAYLDNHIVGTANGIVPPTGGKAGIGIHRWMNNPYGVSTRFVGNIADVRVYNRALGAGEISRLTHPPL